jgi:hypothetical protein
MMTPDPHIEAAIERAIEGQIKQYANLIFRSGQRNGCRRDARQRAILEEAKRRCLKDERRRTILLKDLKAALIEVVRETTLVDHLREKLRQRCYGANG